MSTLAYAPIRIPMVDENGVITPPWAHWLKSLYSRVGGAASPSTSELTETMPEDSGIEELKAAMFSFFDGTGQQPSTALSPSLDTDTESRIAALAEEIAVLRTQITDLQQGLYA